MSTVQKFEDLKVYQQARELTNRVYRLTRQKGFAQDFGLVDQVRRAAVSVMSNIAEGFERGSNTEFTQFLYVAKGSCGEVRAQLAIALDQGYITSPDHATLDRQCRLVSAMLHSLVEYLRGTRLRGAKHRPTHDPKLEAFQAELRRISGRDIPTS